MPNTREKLIEILRNGIFAAADEEDVYKYADVVDYMMAHGVTVATDKNVGNKWINDRLPEKGVPVLGLARRNPFAKRMPMVVKWAGNGMVCLANEQYVDCDCWMPLPIQQGDERQ